MRELDEEYERGVALTEQVKEQIKKETERTKEVLRGYV